MPSLQSRPKQVTNRYNSVTAEKVGGATYTPKPLADFVARKMLEAAPSLPSDRPLRILDPAVGGGELLNSLLELLGDRECEVCGFEINEEAFKGAKARLNKTFPRARLDLREEDFLAHVSDLCGPGLLGGLFAPDAEQTFDLIIANPPYVRTQILGAERARRLGAEFGLEGRVDLYHAFLIGMAKVLRSHGIAGIIVSNRFMTTKTGAGVRRLLQDEFELRHVWDLGDTRLFGAAVLPAVLLAEGRNGRKPNRADFSTVYETPAPAGRRADTIIEALDEPGLVEIPDGRCFHIQHGKLNSAGEGNGVWRISTDESAAWIKTVDENTALRFRDVGRIRVGVKTCADSVFIRKDWDTMPEEERPELLRALTTHHGARSFRAATDREKRMILYPHECVEGGRRAVDIKLYPRTSAYLESHRATLENRRYVIDAGRQWYEIWVPQDPNAWPKVKLIFRDISQKPCFWLDAAGSVVNGDCYWMINETTNDEELLWLALAVANSSFIEAFYDYRFNNKLYAGRRRFMTQYVEQFPLPNPAGKRAAKIIRATKEIYERCDVSDTSNQEAELERLIWKAFGVTPSGP